MTETQAESAQINAEARKQALSNVVQPAVHAGWHVESQSDYHATLAISNNHDQRLHLFLSIITFGLWALFVWLPLSMFGRLRRKIVTIDDYGNLRIRKG